VHPVVVGSGRRLFDDESDPVELALVDSHAYENEVISLTYNPAAPRTPTRSFERLRSSRLGVVLGVERFCVNRSLVGSRCGAAGRVFPSLRRPDQSDLLSLDHR
jgi:hypothetical protein